MKRPLAVVGITMLVTVSALCPTDSPWLCVAVSAAVFVFSLILFILKRKRLSLLCLTVLLTVGVSCLLVLSADALIQKPALESVSRRNTVRLQITDYPTAKNGRFYYIARLQSADSAIKPLVRLSVSENREISSSLEPGDEIEYTGRVYIIAEKNRPIHRYYKSRKILLGSYPTGEISLVRKSGHGVMYRIKNLRRRTENLILRNFESETAGLVISVLLGDKSFVSAETYTLFKASGVAHIMAVSGLHLSIWILFMIRAAVLLGLDERKTASVLLFFTFVMMAFASFSGSVMRAGLMMLLYLVGLSSGKRGDALSSLGFSAVIVLFINPYASMNISFLLSFLSTLAILVFALPVSVAVTGKINRRLKSDKFKRITEAVMTSVFISLSVTLFTLPVTALSFGMVSVVGFMTNLLLLFVITPFVVCSGLFVVFSAVPVLSDVIRLIVSLGAKYLLAVVKLFGSRSFSYYSFNSDTVWVWILLVTVFFSVLYFAIKKKKRVFYLAAAVLLAVSVPCAAFFDYTYEKEHCYLNVYDVSDGLAVSVSYRNHTAVIVGECDSYHLGLIAEKLSRSRDSITVVSLGSLCDLLPIIKKTDCELITGKGADTSVLPPEKRDSVMSAARFTLCDGCEIEIEEEGAVMEANGLRISVSAEKKADCDILITNSKTVLDIPENYAIIVSSETSADDAYSTSDYSDIRLTIDKNGKYTLKGENAWQYLMKSS